MERKKLGVLLVAFVTGVVLLAGSASAAVFDGLKGYILGDTAHGKLVPFFRVGSNLATLIGIESEQHDKAFPAVEYGDVQVHVTLFTKRSAEIQNFELCLSPFDFGFLVLQNGPITPAQADELFGDPHDPSRSRFHKARVLSLGDLGDNKEGYVTIATVNEFFSEDGTCKGALPFLIPDFDVHLATWAILADVGSGFFATEIPTPTAVVNEVTGTVSGLRATAADGIVEASLGLIPAGNDVFARFDVNPVVKSKTEIFVWLKRNSPPRAPAVQGFLECEDELEISTPVPLPDEVNIIDPNTFAGIGQCKLLHQYRGVLLFALPDTGFLWSHITQGTDHFRQNYLGYNLDNNGFVDCADDFNDFGGSSNGLCDGAGAASR